MPLSKFYKNRCRYRGSNVQFAVSPDDGRILVIEMNPRVSRSSALASKATGFPIAKVALNLQSDILLTNSEMKLLKCDTSII